MDYKSGNMGNLHKKGEGGGVPPTKFHTCVKVHCEKFDYFDQSPISQTWKDEKILDDNPRNCRSCVKAHVQNLW